MTDVTIQMTARKIELPTVLSDLDKMVDRQIRAFLDEDNDGRELLQGLYGDVIDQPVPARLTALLRR
jgi:hypothetical protein